MKLPRDHTLLIGGLGWPHDDLVAASLQSSGVVTKTLGSFDAEALERGRIELPRGHCASALYTIGALMRAIDRHDASERLAYLSVHSCGPCRYALFEPNLEHALRRAGRENVAFVAVPQSIAGLRDALGEGPMLRTIDALVAADVLVECTNRLRPHMEEPDLLDQRAYEITATIAEEIANGKSPQDALHEHSTWHRDLMRKSQRPLARAVLIGDPWSLHVHGDGQLNLPRVLAHMGVEIEVPPLALWLLYVLWLARTPWCGDKPPTADAASQSRSFEAQIRGRMAEMAEAVGLGGFEVPQIDHLTELASPHLPASFRGGYGHIEVALAVRAAQERRGHLVLSVKPFACIPSAGVSDAILPAALHGKMPFLSVEVSGDGEAARESRLLLRLSAAIEAARDELSEVCSKRGLDFDEAASLTPPDPLQGQHEVGPRPHASTLACEISEKNDPIGGSA